MRAVCAAPPTGLQQPTLAGGVQQAGKQALGGAVLEQAGAELAQDGEVEAVIRQVEGEQVFPVDPATDGFGRLAVAQPLAELHERDQREPPRRIGGLAALGVEVGEVGVREHRAEPVAQEDIRVAAPERSPGDPGGVVGHGREQLREERHGRPPGKKAIQRRSRSRRCRIRQRYPTGFLVGRGDPGRPRGEAAPAANRKFLALDPGKVADEDAALSSAD